MGFFTRLEQRAKQIDSLLCVGLDPHLKDLPAPLGLAAKEFCFRIIEATHDLALAYKPNSAFFEVFGPSGIQALEEVIAAVPDGIPVILDAKRGDIASTANAYAQAAFEGLKADAITLNPYLGRDAVEPFLQDPAHGVFLLCKTSNPGSGDMQDLPLLSGEPLYVQVAASAARWNERDNLGLVVGATHPQTLNQIRQAAPDLWILAPGLGAQGGDLDTTLVNGLRDDGYGLVFPVSRGISQAEDPRRAASEFRERINAARSKQALKPQKAPSPEEDLAIALFEAGCVKFGDFTLKSGLTSPVYIDLRLLAGYPKLLFQVAGAYRRLLQGLSFDRLAGIPYAAIPIATAASLQGGWPMIYPRKETKDYGTKAAIEGEFHPGERAVVLDDLTTTGGSKFETIDKLTAAGLEVTDIVVLIDRESGASELLAEGGFRLHAVFTLSQLAGILLEKKLIDPGQHQAVLDFIAGSSSN